MELEDAMKMQYEIGEDKCIKIVMDPDDPTTPDVVNTKRSWRQSIVHCQKMDEGGYGAMFSGIPLFRSNLTDTRILWILSGMLVCVK